MALLKDPTVGSWVLVKRGNEPIWLSVVAVNAALQQLIGQAAATTISAGLNSGDQTQVGYNEVLQMQPGTPTHPQASTVRPPSPNEHASMSRF